MVPSVDLLPNAHLSMNLNHAGLCAAFPDAILVLMIDQICPMF